MTTILPTVACVCGNDLNADRLGYFCNADGVLTDHYGAFPWLLSPRSWDDAFTESSFTISNGDTWTVGAEPWQLSLDAINPADYSVLVIPDGAFALEGGAAASLAGPLQHFVEAGKEIFAFGNGIMLAALAGLADLVDPSREVQVSATGFPELAGDLAANGVTWVAPDPASHIVVWAPPPEHDEIAASLRVVTSQVPDDALGVLVSRMVSAGVPAE